jgi:hypothetical protein
MASAVAVIRPRFEFAPVLLWEVQGRTTEPVTCALRRASDGAHIVTVALRGQLVYAEEFEGEVEALQHAAFLCDDYVDSGWTQIVRRDARLDRAGEASGVGQASGAA